MASTWYHIARRDVRAAAGSPLLWLVLAAWLAIVHGAFAWTLWQTQGHEVASYVPLYVNALWTGGVLLMFFAPALTMNAWAAERAQGTWQLLMTVAVRERDLVLGKFVGSLVLLLLLLAATVGLPATLAVVSDVSPPHALACYVGLVLLAAFLAAIGTWIGVLVDGPVAAYILTFAVVAALWLAGLGGADGALGPVGSACGLSDRIGPFLAGRIGLAEVTWFAAGVGICLMLTHGAVRALRQGGGQAWWRRAGMIGGPTLAVTLLLVLAVAAASKSGLALDLSADQRFTLAPALLRQAEASTGQTALVGVWDDGLDGALAPITAVCTRLADAEGRVTWKRLDPLRHRPALADFAAQHGDPGAPAVWVVRGDRALRIALTRASRRSLQRDLAGALLTLDDPAPPTVHLLQGHGELRPNGGRDDGCGLLLGTLHAAGLRTATIDDTSPPVPDGDVVAVLGPTAALGAATIGRLDTHLRDGGGVLVLSDDRGPLDLGVWLRRRGVLWAGAVPRALADGGSDMSALLDPAAPCLPPRHLVSLARHWVGGELDLPHHNLLLRDREMLNDTHPLTAALVAGGVQILSPFTAACEALPVDLVTRAGTPPFTATALLRTAPGDVWERARGEPLRIPEGLDQADARMLAWAIAYQPAADAASAARGARLVVWGSRQAAGDATIGQAAFANGQLLANACRWLARREAPPDVPETETRAFQVLVPESTLRLLIALLVAIIPVLCIGGALVAWFERRR